MADFSYLYLLLAILMSWLWRKEGNVRGGPVLTAGIASWPFDQVQNSAWTTYLVFKTLFLQWLLSTLVAKALLHHLYSTSYAGWALLYCSFLSHSGPCYTVYNLFICACFFFKSVCILRERAILFLVPNAAPGT